MAGLISYPDHWNFLHISGKAVSLPVTRVLTEQPLISFESFPLPHSLADWHGRLSSRPLLAVDVPSSLSLVVSSFRFKVRDIRLEHLEATEGLLIG